MTTTEKHERLLAEFERHMLEVLAETPHVKAYRIAEPGTRIMSATIVAGPDGVTITGDVRFGNRNVLHAEDKPLRWFTSPDLHTARDYLAGKFRVPRKWDGDFARTCAEEWADDGEEDLELDAVEWDNEHEAQMYLVGTFGEGIDVPYDKHAVDALCAIQATFSRLYAEYMGIAG